MPPPRKGRNTCACVWNRRSLSFAKSNAPLPQCLRYLGFGELLKWHPRVEPIPYARSRRTVQVAQHDHRLARFRIHAQNGVHSRSAAAMAVGPRLVRPAELESEAVVAGRELRTRGLG